MEADAETLKHRRVCGMDLVALSLLETPQRASMAPHRNFEKD
jgi:hypothetical protein